MKKFLIILLSLVLIVFCVGCGTYSPAKSDGSFSAGGTNGGKNDPVDPPGGGGGVENGIPFKVTLTYKDPYTGEPSRFYPSADMNIKAQWKAEDGSIYDAEFVNGTATKNLDGDYTVSLSNLDNKYAYDPNGLEVNNNNPNITIELMSLTTPNPRAGRSDYVGGITGCIAVSKLGAYRITLNNAEDKIYFEYKPEQAGSFVIESLVDTTANEVNPTVYVLYASTVAYKNWSNADKVEDGGAAGTYTKNFRFQINMGNEYKGNSYSFYIQANTPNANGYPAEVTFKMTYIGAYDDYKPVYANGPFYDNPAPEDYAGTWHWSYRDNPQANSPNAFVTDGTFDGEKTVDMRFRLNWVDTNGNGVYDAGIDGGDGFYHWYDEAKYASTGGWGPLLWAVIWKDTEIYKTIEGYPPDYDYFRGADKSHTEFPERRNYSNFWSTYQMYSHDGAHPVNQEIMEALQFLLVANQFFYDGMGDAEAGKCPITINSYNNFMFLGVCGYYEK